MKLWFIRTVTCCSTDVVTLMTSSVGILAQVNTTYRCLTATPVPVGGATVTLSEMKLEAYMPGDDLSPNGVHQHLCVCVCLSFCAPVSAVLNPPRLCSQRACVRLIRAPPPRPRHPPPRPLPSPPLPEHLTGVTMP